MHIISAIVILHRYIKIVYIAVRVFTCWSFEQT